MISKGTSLERSGHSHAHIMLPCQLNLYAIFNLTSSEYMRLSEHTYLPFYCLLQLWIMILVDGAEFLCTCERGWLGRGTHRPRPLILCRRDQMHMSKCLCFWLRNPWLFQLPFLAESSIILFPGNHILSYRCSVPAQGPGSGQA